MFSGVGELTIKGWKSFRLNVDPLYYCIAGAACLLHMPVRFIKIFPVQNCDFYPPFKSCHICYTHSERFHLLLNVFCQNSCVKIF